MDTNISTYVVTSGILLLIAGIAAYPYILTYENTSWMPRWMRPDVDYLERPYDYGYPAHLPQSAFCLSVMAIGFIVACSEFIGDIPGIVSLAHKALGCLTLLFPAYIVCRTFAVRTLKVDGVTCYGDAITRPREWKTSIAVGVPFIFFAAYAADFIPFTSFRIGSTAYSLVAAAFLAYDFRCVYWKRVRSDYSTHRLTFAQMCPESLYLLFYLTGTSILQAFLWTDIFWLPCVFAGAIPLFVIVNYALGFHPGFQTDYRERTYHYLRGSRRWQSISLAEKLCGLAARGRNIFEDDGKHVWFVNVCRNPHYHDYLYTCTTDPAEQTLQLKQAGEEVVACRKFGTLREAFEFRLGMMRKYEQIHRNACHKEEREAEMLFEEELQETEIKEFEDCKAIV